MTSTASSDAGRRGAGSAWKSCAGPYGSIRAASRRRPVERAPGAPVLLPARSSGHSPPSGCSSTATTRTRDKPRARSRGVAPVRPTTRCAIRPRRRRCCPASRPPSARAPPPPAPAPRRRRAAFAPHSSERWSSTPRLPSSRATLTPSCRCRALPTRPCTPATSRAASPQRQDVG